MKTNLKTKMSTGEVKKALRKDVYKEGFIILSDYRDFGQTYSSEWTDAEIVEDLLRDYHDYHEEEGDEIREICVKKVVRWEFMED